ncbi:MAG: hypothetical protein ACTSVB_09745 [Candidatus Heimdallarchaeaceae archaeon]
MRKIFLFFFVFFFIREAFSLLGTQFDLNLRRIKEEVAKLSSNSPWKNSPFLCYVIPPLSPIRRLPDTLPPDGVITDRINLIGAKGEIVCGSFILAPHKEVKKMEVKVSTLKKKLSNRVISKTNIDVRVVKVWWQTGTGWGSYFGDPTRRQLIPELLLHDENLIKVDYKKKENYLRVDYPEGSKYIWISAPPEIDNGKFNHYVEPVADSPTLLPVELRPGENKQFWLTIKIPKKSISGIYEGEIIFIGDGLNVGKLQLQLKVLPFNLPEPKTYYNLKKPFYSTIYNRCDLYRHLRDNGGNWSLAEEKLRAEMKDMLEHNVFHYMQGMVRLFNKENKKIFIRNLQLVKEVGFHSPLLGAFMASGSFWFPPDRTETYEKYLTDAVEAVNLVKKVLGRDWEVYFIGFDEPSRRILLAELPGWKDLHKIGAKIYSTARTTTHFPLVGYAEDIVNCPENKRESAEKWHCLGNAILSYAVPHTGPENPDFVRRRHGLVLYKANFDGTGNYEYYDEHKIWNDFASYKYRGFNMVYPTKVGVIDTIQWEGFRAGIDDIKYATELKIMAEKAISTSKVEAVYEAKKALIWLEQLNEHTADLDSARLEMIEYILRLRKLLGEKE